MSLISPSDAQAVLISWLKGNAPVLVTLKDTKEIREKEYQGQQFSYPNIRVKIDSVIPDPFCNYGKVLFSIDCNTEDKSSKNCNDMAGVIENQLHKKQFSRTINGVPIRFTYVLITHIKGAGRTIYGWQTNLMGSVLVSE